MSIITISRGSYSKGKEVAEEVAQTLGYECVSREILLEASEHFNIPEIKLVRALHDAPSILERFTYGKERYIAYITAAFLEHVHQDNVVYHGLAGQFFLKGVSPRTQSAGSGRFGRQNKAGDEAREHNPGGGPGRFAQGRS